MRKTSQIVCGRISYFLQLDEVMTRKTIPQFLQKRGLDYNQFQFPFSQQCTLSLPIELPPDLSSLLSGMKRRDAFAFLQTSVNFPGDTNTV